MPFHIEMLEAFLSIPENFEELTDTQKFLLYFGAVEIAWMLEIIDEILPVETSEDSVRTKLLIRKMDSQGVFGQISGGPSISSVIFDDRERSLFNSLIPALNASNSKSAILIYGADHQLEDYQIDNLDIKREELNN